MTHAPPPTLPPTYYERPLLREPEWGWQVISYLFLGGVMGGSGILVFLAGDDEDRTLKRNARYVAFALATSCPAILIAHLGRPERFLHMLRVVKFKSVMSMGVWSLIAFSLPTTLAAAAQAARDGLLPASLGWIRRLALPRLLDPLQASIGAFLCGYTGVLLSATAIPVWAIGKRHIPAFSLCSGVAGACALNAALLALEREVPHETLRKIERLESVAAAAEVALVLAFRRHAGKLGDPMFSGPRGKKVGAFTLLGGGLVPAILKFIPVNGRVKTLLGSMLTLVGGYVLRESLIEAGKSSSGDPRAAARQPE